MHAFTALVLALAGSTLAAPTAEERAAAPKFRLSVAGSKDLNGWAVLEAHVAAGTNAIEIQRPAAFQSEVVSFVGDNGKAQIKSNKAGGSTFAYALPSVSNGQIKQVFAQLGAGTNSFGLNGNNRVTANGDAHGFWACPTTVAGDGKPYTLWYGLGVSQSTLPDAKCESIKLVAGPV